MAFLTIITFLVGAFSMIAYGSNNNFSAYYSYLWGTDHFTINPRGTEVQLKLDKSSGAGFRSKLKYGSGLFHIKLKLPRGKTGGVITSFYLTSSPDNNKIPGNHFEIDYEFLGIDRTIQTNVFAGDSGNREQRFKLWFDPSKDFHTYEFLWNSHHIVFMVDGIPIREYKNNKAHGVLYVDKPMHIVGSIWSAYWAGNVNWAYAPFIAYYSDFGFNACPTQSNNISGCASESYFWNRSTSKNLSPTNKARMMTYRKKYMYYDYCSKPSTRKAECSFNV